MTAAGPEAGKAEVPPRPCSRVWKRAFPDRSRRDARRRVGDLSSGSFESEMTSEKPAAGYQAVTAVETDVLFSFSFPRSSALPPPHLGFGDFFFFFLLKWLPGFSRTIQACPEPGPLLAPPPQPWPHSELGCTAPRDRPVMLGGPSPVRRGNLAGPPKSEQHRGDSGTQISS